MFQRLLRVLYGLEFLMALVGIYTMWSAVAGETFDYVAWYWKASIGLLAAAATVALTMAADSQGPARRWRVVVWILVLAVLATGAGLITFHYYLNEPQDGPSDTVTPAAVSIAAPSRHP